MLRTHCPGYIQELGWHSEILVFNQIGRVFFIRLLNFHLLTLLFEPSGQGTKDYLPPFYPRQHWKPRMT